MKSHTNYHGFSKANLKAGLVTRTLRIDRSHSLQTPRFGLQQSNSATIPYTVVATIVFIESRQNNQRDLAAIVD